MRRDPLWRGDRAIGAFRSIELNGLGWAALVATGLALGLVVMLATDVRHPIVFPGSIFLVWLAVTVWDRVKWSKSEISIGHGNLDAASGAAIVEELEKRGIAARYREQEFDENGDVDIQRGIVCRQRDARVVWSVMGERLQPGSPR